MEAHPAAELFPMLSDDRLQELAADIKANTLLEPITLLHGKILDGRNRYRACEIAGITPTTQEYTGKINPVLWVLSKNAQRRDLTAGQRAAAIFEAPELIEQLAQEAQGRMLAGVADPSGGRRYGSSSEMSGSGKTVDQLAEQVGVSGSAVERFGRVRRERPDLGEAVKQGELSLNAAYHIVREASTIRPMRPLLGRRVAPTNKGFKPNEQVERALFAIEVQSGLLAEQLPISELNDVEAEDAHRRLGIVVSRLNKVRRTLNGA